MNEVTFRANDGKTYEICFDDFGEEIRVIFSGNIVGKILLRLVEGDSQHEPESYHITHLALGGCAHQGLGRRCLELHREIFDSPLTAGIDNGSRSEDGSHLTGDGPGFIAKMRIEGIVVSPLTYADPYDQYDE